MESSVGWLLEGSSERAMGSQAEFLAGVVLIATLLIVPLLVFVPRKLRRRHFWCVARRRDVEVEFEERGLPGFRLAVDVKSCSAFDPPTAVACRHRCLDVTFRRRQAPLGSGTQVATQRT